MKGIPINKMISNSQLFYNLTKRKALYNIMPLDNMLSVMERGILSYNASPFDAKSVALEDVQQKRSVKIVDDLRLHDYASLYFDPRNPMMYRIRASRDDICILAVSPEVLDIEGAIVTDVNAATQFARFLDPADMGELDFDSIYDTNWNSQDPDEYKISKAKKCAEVLIPECISFDYVIGALCSSEKTKNKLLEVGFNKEIIVRGKEFFMGY